MQAVVQRFIHSGSGFWARAAKCCAGAQKGPQHRGCTGCRQTRDGGLGKARGGCPGGRRSPPPPAKARFGGSVCRMSERPGRSGRGSLGQTDRVCSSALRC
ncbi:hypothetical protein LG3211_2923 [Lysobacter gummosus]|nr:hypothetical protein LG3211_2923 [Lysobacter gummosus]